MRAEIDTVHKRTAPIVIVKRSLTRQRYISTMPSFIVLNINKTLNEVHDLLSANFIK